MLNFSEKKIKSGEILNLFNMNNNPNPYQSYKAICLVKKHLNKIHHYDLITFTSAESLRRFLAGEFEKIISNENSDAFKKLLKKYHIDLDAQDDFIDVIVNFLNDLESQGVYKKSFFINFNVLEHSIHHNVFLEYFCRS